MKMFILKIHLDRDSSFLLYFNWKATFNSVIVATGKGHISSVG